MDHQLPPIDKIKAFFPNHRICVVKTLLLFLTCVIRSRTVNLNKCKCQAFSATGQKEGKLGSVYTRFIRFFKIRDADSFCLGIALLIARLVQSDDAALLAIDRTNWEIGIKKINILCLGLVLPNGVFIPVMWEILSKKGNSNEQERIALLQRFQQAWPQSRKRQLVVLGDREFIGANWCEWMAKNCLSFVVRLRWQDYFIHAAQTCNLTMFKLEQKIREQVSKTGFFQCAITVKKQAYSFTVLPNTAKRRPQTKSNAGDDFVVLLSPLEDASVVSRYYRKRWAIEVFFRHVKQNGFNLENLNLKEQQKVQLMVGVVALAYVLSVQQGFLLESNQTIKIKKHGARAVSIFRKGYDQLLACIQNLKEIIQFIIKILLKQYKRELLS